MQYGDNTPLFTSVFNVVLDDQEDKLDMFGAKLPKQNMSVELQFLVIDKMLRLCIFIDRYRF